MKVGDIFNGYTIIAHVKDGGMGSVYKVEKNGVYYAMKTILPSADDEEKARFRRETRMLLSVKDNNVIEILDYDLSANEPYYIMPFCTSSLTSETTKLSDDEKMEVCTCFCKGINAIHQAGISHRDIKPDNVLFFNGVLKVTDLGGGRFVNRDTQTLTQYGDYIGTYGYLPPEYKSDPEAFKNGTKQGDIYMIGKTIYYVMSNGGDVSNVDLSTVSSDIAPIIERCLKTSLNERYGNVEEIIADLNILQNVRSQLQQMPKSLDEILKEQPATMYEALYNRLLFDSKDEQSLYKLLSNLSDDTLNSLFMKKANMLNNYIGVFNQILRHPHGFIQFEYIEVYVNVIKIMFNICRTSYHKQVLLDLAFDLAIQHNRYPAMLIIGEILSKLSDADARSLGSFFMRRREDILHMKPNFKHPMHYIINNLVSSTRTI